MTLFSPPVVSRPLVAVKLPQWQKRCVYASFALLALSGLGWLLVKFLMATLAGTGEDDLSQQAFERMLQLWCIRIHAAAALGVLVMLGSLLTVHMRTAWFLQRNRASGATLVGAMALLALTGYALGYASEGGLRQWSAWLHWAFGVGAPVLLFLHVRWGKRIQSN